MAFYFTKTETHILLFLLTPYEGSAPVPRWRLPSPRPPAVSPTMEQIDAYVRPTCNSALNAKYYTTATTRPGHVTCPGLVDTWIQIGSKMAEKTAQTNRQTNRHYENNGHLAVNQYSARAELTGTENKCLNKSCSDDKQHCSWQVEIVQLFD